MTMMMPRHILEVIWQRMGQQIARARSTEMATRVLIDADTLTPCRYVTALQMNQPNTHAAEETNKNH